MIMSNVTIQHLDLTSLNHFYLFLQSFIESISMQEPGNVSPTGSKDFFSQSRVARKEIMLFIKKQMKPLFSEPDDTLTIQMENEIS